MSGMLGLHMQARRLASRFGEQHVAENVGFEVISLPGGGDESRALLIPLPEYKTVGGLPPDPSLASGSPVDETTQGTGVTNACVVIDV
jgi:hypothetical protein